jgi:hypothetical protein
MTIRKIHSNDVTNNRSDIATQYNDIFFDDQANSILLPDPTGLLETKIGATATAATGIKGFASGYVDAGQFVTLDNLKFSVTTGGNRGLCCATVTGTATLSISANYGMAGGANGWATNYPGASYTTTPSGSWFGWSFPNAGDGSTYLVNDYTNQRFYRVTLMIGAYYLKNFISIERLG